MLGRTFDGLESLEKPVIAAIAGTCGGGGYELALAGEGRVAAPDATIGFPDHTIGLHPGLGRFSRFVDLVGLGRAKDLIFCGELVDGGRALELGMVEQLAADPRAFAHEYAEDLLAKPPRALGTPSGSRRPRGTRTSPPPGCSNRWLRAR